LAIAKRTDETFAPSIRLKASRNTDFSGAPLGGAHHGLRPFLGEFQMIA
jgi:hypothetical protein